MKGAHPANPIRSTERSCEIISVLRRKGPSTLKEVTAEVSVSKGSVYNHLATLEGAGVVSKKDNQYLLSPTILSLGVAARKAYPGVDAVRRRTTTLASTTGEFVLVTVLDGDEAVIVDGVGGQLAELDYLQLGDTLPLHTTAAGKALASEFNDDRILNYCDSRSIDSDSFLEEMKTVRAQGIAFSRGEYIEDHYSVAVSITDTENTPLCSIAIAGPESRLSGKSLQQDIAGLVVRAANEAEREATLG